MIQHIHPAKRTGIIQIPPSKSDSQRAFLSAGLAAGKSRIFFSGRSNDELKMLDVIKQFGAKVTNIDATTIEIIGTEDFPSKLTLNAGESGLCVRLLTSICAAHDGEFNLVGEGSLVQREMRFFTEEFPKLNVSFESNSGFLPFNVKGPIRSTSLVVDGSQSSQYISGLLMALPLIEGKTTLSVANLKSTPYLNMTLNTISVFGINIERKENNTFLIPGNQTYKATDYTIESDWSAASFWLVASALGAEIKVKGLSMSSLQADKAILQAFVSAGCSVLKDSNGIAILGKDKHAFEFDATDCPDLFPALVAFASFINGVSRISGVHRLASKESNRGEVLQQEFAKLGVVIEQIEDSFYIHGNGTMNGGMVNAHNDHRIAMCFGIAGMFASQEVIIEQAESVAKSYPSFWDDLNSLSMQ
jgi:3-phosphoshikimate 1-carboxyvinyltransferase